MSFKRVNRLFVLSYENIRQWTSYKQYFLPTVRKKDCNVIIDRRNVFGQPVKNDLRTYDNIWKIGTDLGDDYTTGWLLDYPYFKKHCKLIAIDLRKQQALDADPKAIQKINVTGNLEEDRNTTMFFVIEEAKEIILDFSQGIVRAF